MNKFHAMAACVLVAALLLGAAPALAQGEGGFASQQTEVDGRLDGALRELASERARIAKQKLPLSQTVAALEAEVATLRKERERFQKVQDASTIDLAALRKQVASLRDQDEFIKSRLSEFLRDFEGRLNIAELPRFAAAVTSS